MAVKNTRSSTRVLVENAFTNNTFDLHEVEMTIRSVLENSFNYLMGLEESYVNVCRFNLTSDDIYTNQDGKICVSVPKNFIDEVDRKPYKYSDYYNKYIDLDTITANTHLFHYMPFVTIDSKPIFSILVKPSLDGHTDIVFTHANSLNTLTSSYHKIEVTFFRNCTIHHFVTHQPIMNKYGYKLPLSVVKTTIKKRGPVFVCLRGTTKTYSSNMVEGTITDDNKLDLSGNSFVTNIFTSNREVEVFVLCLDYLYELDGYKTIQTRIDNSKKSAIAVVQKEELVDYKMPIPPENLLVFTHNKSTNELIFQNDRDVVVHFPNIYEIDAEDLNPSAYNFKGYYLYYETENKFKYQNWFHYIYRYLASRLGFTYEKTVNELLYKTYSDEKIQDYFLRLFAYSEPYYEYAHGEYFKTLSPYDLDYKVEKMSDFINADPYAFRRYASHVQAPASNYYLYTDDIDLPERIRYNTEEELPDMTPVVFTEPHYMFRFGNDTDTLLSLRFFIDGLFCQDFKAYHSNGVDFIYIPVSLVPDNSYIEVEKFEDYTLLQSVVFESKDEPVTLEFPNKKYIKPTLYDLFATNTEYGRIPNSNFKMYALLDSTKVSLQSILDSVKYDYVLPNYTEDLLYIDPETGEEYINLSSEVIEMINQYLLDHVGEAEESFDPDHEEERIITDPLESSLSPYYVYDIDVQDELANHLKAEAEYNRVYLQKDSIKYATEIESQELDIDKMYDLDVENALAAKLLEGDEEIILGDKLRKILLASSDVADDIVAADQHEEMNERNSQLLRAQYLFLNKMKVFCVNEDLLHNTIYFILNKIPYLMTANLQADGLFKIKFFNGEIPWKRERSYMRIFINGRLHNITCKIAQENEDTTYIIPYVFLNKGDVVSIDISPFSYNLEYQADEIPENYMVSFADKLSMPFSLKYYDVYLNGRKLGAENIQAVTPTLVKLINVKSRKNLLVFSKDRDEEFFGFNIRSYTFLDDFMSLDFITSEEKEEVVRWIIDDQYRKDYEDGVDIEEDMSDLYHNVSEDTFSHYVFLINTVIEPGGLKPNTLTIDSDTLETEYPIINELYCRNGRVVLKPNLRPDADTVIRIGKDNYLYNVT